ncbi:glycoside hydrolase family 2, partial [bacterium]
MPHLLSPKFWTLAATTVTFTLGSFISACAQTRQPLAALPAKVDPLAANFQTPPDRTKPRTYWYWIDGRVSKDGITRDLENMKKVGVGEAYIGLLGGEAGDTGPGGIPTLTPEWWGMLEHAVREGGRLGVDIGIFNGPGWSQSGGPWVKPEQSMRHLVTTELRLKGPQHFEGTLAAPPRALPGQDVVTLAFPAPALDTDAITAHNPKISGDAETAKLFDGDSNTSASPPEADGKRSITLEVEQPFTARSLVFHPQREIVSSGELQVSDDGVTYRKVCDYTIDRHYLAPALGPEGLAPISLSFPASTGRYFRLTFSNGDPIKEIVLSGAARIESYAEKHLGKMFQGPQPPDNYYDWPHQPEPDKASLSIPPAQVENVSANLKGDQFSWDVPAGEWVVQRIA